MRTNNRTAKASGETYKRSNRSSEHIWEKYRTVRPFRPRGLENQETGGLAGGETGTADWKIIRMTLPLK